MARTFFDSNTRPWILNLTWDKADTIASRVERPDSTPEKPKTFDLFNMTDKEQAEAFIISDPYTGSFLRKNAGCLVNLMYVLCEEQCKEREMSDEDFGKMLATGLFGKAYALLMEEIVNFIPDPERQKMFQSLLFLAGGNQSAVLSEANRILESKKTALTAQTTRIIEDKMEEAWAPVTEALIKAAGDGGTTNSSKSAANSESTQVN